MIEPNVKIIEYDVNDTSKPKMYAHKLEQAINYSSINFIAENGYLYLVRCPECGIINYSPAVTSGQCAWCGWSVYEDDRNMDKVEEKLRKEILGEE